MALDVPTAASLTVCSTPAARGRLLLCQAVSHTKLVALEPGSTDARNLPSSSSAQGLASETIN